MEIGISWNHLLDACGVGNSPVAGYLVWSLLNFCRRLVRVRIAEFSYADRLRYSCHGIVYSLFPCPPCRGKRIKTKTKSKWVYSFDRILLGMTSWRQSTTDPNNVHAYTRDPPLSFTIIIQFRINNHYWWMMLEQCLRHVMIVRFSGN